MNIQKVYNVQSSAALNIYARKNTALYNYSGIQVSLPLKGDVVSFHGKGAVVTKELKAAFARKEARSIRDAKLIADAKISPDKTKQTKKHLNGEERTWGVSKSTAKQIREIILEPQKQIHNFMGRIFGDLKVSTLSPQNPVFDYSDRAKSILSIMEKSSTRKWNSVKEVLANMTDLNGAKIIMNFKTGHDDAETVIDRLIPLIKTKQITLHEIELQRPAAIKLRTKTDQEEFDYVSHAFLDKLEDAQEEVINGLESNPEKIILIDRPLPKYSEGNYCALHLLLSLNEKGARPFELQIMGPRMAKAKSIDDKRFKFFDGKNIEPIYGDLIALWSVLNAEENKAAKEVFLKYCRDANFQVRADEIYEYKTKRFVNRSSGFFKTVREYKLTPEYDLNELYAIMINCEQKAAHEAKNVQETIKSDKPDKPIRTSVIKGVARKFIDPLHPQKAINKVIKKFQERRLEKEKLKS